MYVRGRLTRARELSLMPIKFCRIVGNGARATPSAQEQERHTGTGAEDSEGHGPATPDQSY